MVFRNDYWFLSNMYPCEVKIKVRGEYYIFSCVESAFQALKCTDIETFKTFINLNGKEAKALGRKVKLRNDWNEVREVIMYKLLKIKFKDEVLKEKLKNVKGLIIEDNSWGDTYWGVCNGKGLNKLGKLLMMIRSR